MVQWLRLCASTAGGTGSIPGQGTEIPHAVQPKQQIKIHKHNTKLKICPCREAIEATLGIEGFPSKKQVGLCGRKPQALNSSCSSAKELIQIYILCISSVQSLSHARLSVTPWTAARQASLPRLLAHDQCMLSHDISACSAT